MSGGSGTFQALLDPSAAARRSPAEARVAYHRAFAELHPAARERLAAISEERVYEARATVLAPGAPSTHFLVVCDGLVRSGTEIVAKGRGVGDWCVMSGRGHDHVALALSRVTILAIPSTAAIDEIRREPRAATEMAAECARYALRARAYITSLGKCVEERLRAVIADLYNELGDEYVDRPGRGFLRIPLQRADYGCLIGTSPETAIRSFGKLKANGLIEEHGAGIDVPMIERLRKPWMTG